MSENDPGIIYRVHVDYGGKVELIELSVRKWTPQSAWVGACSATMHRCKISRKQVEFGWALTPLEAWQKFGVRATNSHNHHTERVRVAAGHVALADFKIKELS